MTSKWCVGSFFELPLSDVTVVEGEKAVLECRVTVAPAAEVTWFTVRGLRAGAGIDYYFRVIAENGAGASQLLTLDRSFVPRTSYDKPRTSRRSDVTRSSVALSWLARRWTAERRSWPTSSSSPEHPSPTWTHVA